MAWRCTSSTLVGLVTNLKKSGIIQSENVKNAMLRIDRKNYVLNKDVESAYGDHPLSIGYGVTISAPHMHAHCLEFLNDFLKPGMRALDVGSGSGYLVACMAEMVTSDGNTNGKVYGIEYIEPVYEQSLKNLSQDSYISNNTNLKNSIILKCGDGWNGFAEGAPFNAIHVGAAAATVPSKLVEQLASPGRLVIPVGTNSQSLMIIDKDEKGKITKQIAMGVRYVPLVNPHNVA